MLYGALEAGGTKMVVALGDENGKILEQKSIPTVTPAETMPAVFDFFRGKGIKALGIACFGPIDLNRQSSTYGFITTTPKIPWRNYDIVGDARKSLGVPVGFDTDVNGSLLGEAAWGAAKGLTDAVYFTIGTGVGGGVMTNGKMLHGMMHPELGHLLLRIRPDDPFAGLCPNHGTCFEGMACGPAIEARWGAKAVDLKDRPEVWDLEAWYIAQAVWDCMVTLSPQRFILGGGVMHQAQLFPLIRKYVLEFMNGYLDTAEVHDLDHYIVPASLHDDQGIMGCIRLARDFAD